LDAVDVGELSSFAASTVCIFCMLNINQLSYLLIVVSQDYCKIRLLPKQN